MITHNLISPPSKLCGYLSRLGKVGTKSALRLAERAVFTAGMQADTPPDEMKSAQLSALRSILDDFAGDEALASKECEVI